MFTGIIEETGTVQGIKQSAKSIEIAVRMKLCGHGLKSGDSLAVNGCCLTVVKLASYGPFKVARFDVLEESWHRTNLQFVKAGSLVNLERPLRAGDRLGGHFVSGHVDGLGRIARWEKAGTDYVLEIAAPSDIMRYIVFKGSVAVDGVSLTVAGVTKRSFRIWIIPHTREMTALRQRKKGDAVNLEADLLGKYVEKFVGRGK
ncbi:MAG: riboflavin synthase [Verrucomicrobia bacterium]|nr:MAG: riboflavin synthase [Verrucomicrobiota bacterium]